MAPVTLSIQRPMKNQNPNSQPAVSPVILCLIFVTLKFIIPRRARCESSGPNLNHRSPNAPASDRRSRRKTLSRTDLDVIPMYKARSFPANRIRSGSPDAERGFTSRHTSSNQSNRTLSSELADHRFALRLDISHTICGSSNSTCAVCTEDFMRGQLLRNLPCHHQYHAKCIDGWLTNVSGSCPLCRWDLCDIRSLEEINTQQNLPVQPPQAVIAQHPHW